MFKFLKYIDLLGDNRKMIDEFGAFLEVFEKKSELKNLYQSLTNLPKKNRDQENIDKIIGKHFNTVANSNLIEKKICIAFERYISIKQISKKENEFNKKQLFLQFIKDKKNEDLYLQTLRESEKILKKSYQIKSAKSTLLEYNIYLEYYFHPSFNKGESALCAEHIQLIDKTLDNFYSVSKRKIASEILAIERATNKKVNFPSLSYVLSGSYDKDPAYILSDIFKKNILLIQNYSDEGYYELKKLIYQYSDDIEAADLSYLHTSLFNHMIYAIRIYGEDRTLEDKYLMEYLNILKYAVSNHIIFEYGFLDSNTYMNYINIACRLGKTAEAKLFAIEHKKRIKNDLRGQVFKISMARIHLSDKEYFLALKTLYKKTFREFELSLMARSLRLACFFEIFINDDLDMLLDGEDLFIDKEIASFKVFVSRSKKKFGKENQRIIANENFIIIVGKMVKNVFNNTIKKKLKKELKEKRIIVFRDWVDSKIEDLS